MRQGAEAALIKDVAKGAPRHPTQEDSREAAATRRGWGAGAGEARLRALRSACVYSRPQGPRVRGG